MEVADLLHDSEPGARRASRRDSQPSRRDQSRLLSFGSSRGSIEDAGARHSTSPSSPSSSRDALGADIVGGAEAFTRSPRTPPSPPVDMMSGRLPPIQNIIGIANASSHRERSSGKMDTYGFQLARQQIGERSVPYRPSPEIKPSRGSGLGLPPTPPLNSVSPSDHRSLLDSHSRMSISSPNRDGRDSVEIQHHKRDSISPGLSSSAYSGQNSRPSTGGSPYLSSSMPTSTLSKPSASQAVSPRIRSDASTISEEPPSPTDSAMPIQHSSSAPSSNPLQHHHYISPAASTAFPHQQADRYVCPTCSKTFSRPSSLRIHSHSHTGEKPFKCSRAGCGKAFSVRSNMKRHERGCHMSGYLPGP